MSDKTRDQNRAAVYAAESQLARLLDRSTDGTATVEFFGSTLTLPIERKFSSVESIQAYVDAVLELDYVTSRWPSLPPIRVRARKGNKKAHWESPNCIAIPFFASRWAERELVVLHEVSHHLDYHSHQYGQASHGPSFTAIFIDLLSVCVGPEVALLLRAGYDGGGVPVGVSPSPVSVSNGS